MPTAKFRPVGGADSAANAAMVARTAPIPPPTRTRKVKSCGTVAAKPLAIIPADISANAERIVGRRP